MRTILQHYGFDEPTDFSVQADLPAAVGLGSSSAFTVSVIKLVSHLMGIPRTPIELAREAIHTEQVLLKENVGVQDQLHTTFGGINRFDLHDDSFRITPINIGGGELRAFSEWMVLVYTGIKRRATDMLAEQVKSTAGGNLDAELREMMGFVSEAQQILEDPERRDDKPARIGRLLDEYWQVKKRLSSNVTSRQIDELYDLCIGHGAIGGKLCGAGGGGFLLMLVPPEGRQAFMQGIGERRCVRFQIDLLGSVLVPSRHD